MKGFFRLDVLNAALIAVGLLFGAYRMGHHAGKREAEKAYYEQMAFWKPTAGTITITQRDDEDPCLWFYTGKDWWTPMERCQEAEQPK